MAEEQDTWLESFTGRSCQNSPTVKMSRSHYHAAEIQQLLLDQGYLRCVKESEKGQTVLCRAPPAPKELGCKKSKEWK